MDEFTPPVDANGNYALASGAAFGPTGFAWTYQASPPASLFSEAISGAQRLPNGNTLIDDGVHGTFLEVTSGGETVWKYVNPVVLGGALAQGEAIPADPARAGEFMNAVFRVYRYGPDYPGLVGRDLTPGLPVERYPDAGARPTYLPMVALTPAVTPLLRRTEDESGLDNSSRFDRAVPLDAVDFSAWAAADMGYLSRIAAELGQQEKAAEWAGRAKEMSAQLHELLWDEAAGFYFDCDMEGRASPVGAATGFMPLLLDDLPVGRAERLVGALRDPKRFGAPFPVPTLALTEPAFSTDMWRGPTWLNLNYFIILGLRKQGQTEAAQWLAEQTLAHVEKYYQRYGVLFEFYDSKDETPPPLCDRKGAHVEPYNIRRKMDSIRDYHWTAAVTALLLQG